jgi:hypothetical protein
MTGGKQWDTAKANDVVSWLESPEGERWSRRKHGPVTFLVTIKPDDIVDPIWNFLWVA